VKRANPALLPVIDRRSEVEPDSSAYLAEEAGNGRKPADRERLWLLWENRRALRRAVLAGFILATIIAFLIPTRYESTTQLMPPDAQSGSSLAMLAALAGRGSSALGGLGLAGMAGDLLGMKSSGALFIDIMGSRTVQDRLIQRFDLRKVYSDRYWKDARDDLAKYTDVSEDRKSGVITITVTDRDPHRAEQLAQAYVEELDRLVAEVSTSAARRERIFVEQRLKTVKQNLDTASQQFSEYASKNTALDINQQGKVMVESAARLQGEIIAAQSQLEGLEQIYTPNNVRVRSLRARIEELQRQLQKLGGDSTPPMSDDPNAAEEYPSIRRLPLLGVRWADLYRETKIQETVYELLTQQYELAKIQEAKEIPTVKILDAASMPEKKASPPRLLIVLAGTLVAFIGGIVWVFGVTTWRTIDIEDPRKRLANEMGGRLRTSAGHLARTAKQRLAFLARFRRSAQAQKPS
jgi:capsule polysaccharide export protein KpsE/RkpR